MKKISCGPGGHQGGGYPRFWRRKGIGIFLLPPPPPLDWMLVHHRVTPSIKFASTHLYTWVERGTVRVKCFAHEQCNVPSNLGRSVRS